MNEMVERIAAAIRRADEVNISNMVYHSMALAAIEAMREPTRAMIAAGNGHYDNALWDGEKTVSHGMFEVMIDAALK